ncbi:hypothetical protein B296_00009058 [Ensete ventricosum]|uniref:Uncharacterized protein n=1 Tax=Ensete ventricosum TaxID=4639 RepID=A0A427AQM4_ENSVE|nr:hypothetical protein B296_00009058 [Ensete ventricosum]
MKEKPGSLHLLALMGHREVLRDARVAPRLTGYSDLRADELPRLYLICPCRGPLESDGVGVRPFSQHSHLRGRGRGYRLGLVLVAYTWTLEGFSLALKGCASSLGRRLVDREPGWLSRAGVDF